MANNEKKVEDLINRLEDIKMALLYASPTQRSAEWINAELIEIGNLLTNTLDAIEEGRVDAPAEKGKDVGNTKLGTNHPKRATAKAEAGVQPVAGERTVDANRNRSGQNPTSGDAGTS